MESNTSIIVLVDCQSGIWKAVGGNGSTVNTGYIGNGGTIPLPPGYTASQCDWSASNATNYHGATPTSFAGEVAYADNNRLVTCGFYDNYSFRTAHAANNWVGFYCAYIITCK